MTTTPAEATATPTAWEYSGNPAFATLVKSVREQALTFIGQANEIRERLEKAQNVKATIAEIRNDSETEDPQILAFRKWLEDMEDQIIAAEKVIDEHIRKNHPTLQGVESLDLAALTEEHKSLTEAVKGLTGSLAALPENIGEDAAKSLPPLYALTSNRVVTTIRGEGVEKPRIDKIRIRVAGTDTWADVFYAQKVKKDGVDTGETRKVVNTTVLGNHLKAVAKKAGLDPATVDPSAIRENMYEAAGTRDLKSLDGKPFTFVQSVGDQNVEVEVTPRP